MTGLVDGTEWVRAQSVSVRDGKLIVNLVDGRTIMVPLDWFPRLNEASLEGQRAYELLGDGVVITWPALDEDISVAGLLRGFSSVISEIGSESPQILSSTHESHNTAGIGTGADERA